MYSFSSYLIVFVCIFSSFVNINFIGITSNPIFLISSLLLTLNKIKIKLINKKIIPLLIINFFATVFVYINGNKGFDFLFLFLYLCTIYLIISVENFAIKIANINNKKFKIIINQISNFFVLFSIFIFALNTFNLHCIFFKCRVFGPYGFSLSNSEPSYVGLFSLLYISFAFLAKDLISSIKFLIIIISGLLGTVLSKSLVSILGLLIISSFSIFPILMAEINLFFKKLRFSKIWIRFIFISSLIIVLQAYLGDLSKLINEVVLAYTPLLKMIDYSDPENYKIIFRLSGKRLFYLLASFNSSFINLICGHGFLSSTSIYTSKVIDITDTLGFSVGSLFDKLQIMVAKPHTTLGFIIFTNGFGGLYILFKREINMLVKNIFNYKFNHISLENNNNKINLFINNWFVILPFLLLIYPSTNTDTFKYGTFLIYFIYLYRKDFKKR